MSVTVIHGDSLVELTKIETASVDSIVCDPPYALGFMGKAWDTHTPRGFQAWCEAWAMEALRVLKPGGHLLAFGGTRTYHRLTAGIEDAGFEIRDSLHWLYGSGFPKSLDVSKAIDKAAGAERARIPFVGGLRPGDAPGCHGNLLSGEVGMYRGTAQSAVPATEHAKTWKGWGTALKPAHEPIVLARKPLVGTVAANVLLHGTGALNVDGCRVAGGEAWRGNSAPSTSANGYGPADEDGWQGNWTKRSESHAAGRWPANVLLDGEAAGMLDEQSGTLSPASTYVRGSGRRAGRDVYAAGMGHTAVGDVAHSYGDCGGASRFFPVFKYQAKAGKRERPEVDGVKHPTVKPVELMRWLVRLVTPAGGLVLDPFAGSGATLEAAQLEGMRAIGIELTAEYIPLIEKRLSKYEHEAA